MPSKAMASELALHLFVATLKLHLTLAALACVTFAVLAEMPWPTLVSFCWQVLLALFIVFCNMDARLMDGHFYVPLFLPW